MPIDIALDFRLQAQYGLNLVLILVFERNAILSL